MSASPELSELQNEPLEKRATLLLAEYAAYAPLPLGYITETASEPYPANPGFKPGAYITLHVELNNAPFATGEIAAPVNPGDENMLRRLGREQLIREELVRPRDPELGNPDLLQYFRFPRTIATQIYDHPKLARWPVSRLDEHIDSMPSGSVHLATPGVFSRDNVRHIAQLIAHLQRVGQRFTEGEDFHHRFISYGPADGDNFKWVRDFDGRAETYRTLLGGGFVDKLHDLLNPADLAKLFNRRVVVFGNLIPPNIRFDAQGKMVILAERTAYATFQGSDNATVLSSLVSDLDRFADFMKFSLEPTGSRILYEHTRRSFLLDRLWNAKAIQDAYDAAAASGNEQERRRLGEPLQNFKDLAVQALDMTGVWNPATYGITEML